MRRGGCGVSGGEVMLKNGGGLMGGREAVMLRGGRGWMGGSEAGMPEGWYV